MTNIGFRVKLNNYINDRSILNDFLYLYFSKFDIMEIKVNSSLINSKNFDYFLSCIQDKNISFHLSKNYIINPTNDDKTIIDNLPKDTRILVTHIPEIVSMKDMYNISKNLPKNIKLLVENPKTFSKKDYIKYLLYIKNIIQNFNNLGLCLDLGHYYFNSCINNKNNYSTFLKDEISLKNIDEIHIHDFDKSGDHKKIGDGQIEEIIKQEEIKFNDCSRIIIETNVESSDLSDGTKQVKRILNYRI